MDGDGPREPGTPTASGPATGRWASLFSGGKDSTWALYRAVEARDLDVARLVTVHPADDSHLYHAPATDLAPLLAESVGLPLVEVDAAVPGGAARDAAERGDAELRPLAAALADLDGRLDGGLAGVTVGAVESAFQRDRVAAVCDDLGADLYAPLWGADPVPALRRMLAAGFEIRVVAVAAAGLDRSWLGRWLDAETVDELAALADDRGVHPMGEGGEFETLVTDGPHMDRPLELTYDVEWDGVRGRVVVTDAWLG